MLDYLELVAEARRLDDRARPKSLRLAILADCATQHLVPLIRVLFARRGVNCIVYEGGYDSVEIESLDATSQLYQFKPDIIVILCASEKVKAKLYAAADRGAFVDNTIGRMAGCWEAVQANCQATIIQTTYVLPSERSYGNYELKVPDSVGSLFTDLNARLVEAARETRHVLLCDLDHIAAEVGRRNWTDETLWHLSKGLCRLDYLPLVAQSLVDISLSAQGVFTKCVVLDLDNTLWGGVIGDDGLSGIALGDLDEGEAFVAFQRFLKECKRRGIILAVVSKNEEAAALAPFREHPDMVLAEDDIAVFIANWDNKAENIRRVQSILNIGFDSMVFLDDNPFERNLVRDLLPDITIPELPDDPALYLRSIGDCGLFETASYSPNDAERANQYRAESARETIRARFTNIDDYLKSLDMTIRVERFKAFNLPRIAQLIQRSNQFNLTTRRHGEAACAAMMDDPGIIPLTVTLTDKFGDYGLISVVILKRHAASLEIETYLMSCRVLMRGVEQFVMNTIFEYAAREGIENVTGRYVATPKNAMVRNFYADFGFQMQDDDANGTTTWSLPPSRYAPRPAFMACQITEF
jgi:FkbH-like protein